MSSPQPNPYDWQSSHPSIEIGQPEVDAVAATLRRGGSALMLGGRGMGKSVFLHQLAVALADESELAVVVINGPPAELSVRGCFERLADALGVELMTPLSSAKILDAWLRRADTPQRLVLLFDEFDRYGGGNPANPPARAFFNDLELTRRELPEFGVLAAGSVGVFAFRDSLGSSFLSRAEHRSLTPFNRSAIAELAAPLTRRREPLAEELLDALHLASGGVPAILAYGLQELWELEPPLYPRDVSRIYAQFQQVHYGYINDVHKAFADPVLSAAPRKVLDFFRQSSEPPARAELEKLCQEARGPLDLNLADVLLVLAAAGLLHLESSAFAGDPVRGHPIPGLLNLPTAAPEAATFGERLRRDLELLLAKLHQASVDFFRPGNAGREKTLVPESVFSAHLALGFELLGWRAEREAQSAAGRTDLKLRYNGGDEVAVVEVKIWGRPGAKQAQQQVESYWSAEVQAGAVVQISAADPAQKPEVWPEIYRREALTEVSSVEPRVIEQTPLVAAFEVHAQISPGIDTQICHYLLRLARR